MPIYEYKGQQYDISTDDPAEAKSKILSHLEKSASAPVATPAPVAPEPAVSAPTKRDTGPSSVDVWKAGPRNKVVDPLYAGAYGLTSSALGSLGEMEKFVGVDVPKYLGLAPKKKEQYLGRETIFPTMQEVGKGMQALGLPKPAIGTETAQEIGEFVPYGFASLGPLQKLGKFGLGKASDLADLLRGRKTAAQAEEVAKAAREAEAAGGKSLTSAQKQQQRELAKTQAQPEIAETAKAKAQDEGGKALRELTGVRTLPEAGGFKPIPQTASQVGGFIRDQAEKFVSAIKSQRNAAADASFTAAKNDAAIRQRAGPAMIESQKLGQFVDTKPLLAQIDGLISRGGSSDYLRSISQLRKDLESTKDFEGLEVIRRRLGDAAFGFPEEGYKAIGQGFAKDMYRGLAKQMRSYSPEFFGKYLDDYKRLSQNIEAYGTKVGKSLTETQDASGKYYTKTAEQVAKDIFSSPEKYKTFVDAVGGNKQIAEAAARRYFAGLAESEKTSTKVEELLRKNRAVLDEIPNVRKEITDRYLNALRQSEGRFAAAEKISKESSKFNEALSKKLGNIAEAKTLFSDSVEAIASAKPNDAIRTFEETVLPKIRKAEQTAGTQILSEQQIQMLRQQVQQLEKIANKTEKAKMLTKIFASAIGASGLVAGIEKLTSTLSKE